MVSRATLIAGLDHEIAHAIARRMAARGDHVALMGAEDPAPTLGRDVAGLEMLRCSLADRSAVESALVRVEDRLGPLHHLIFGTSPPGRLLPLDATTRAVWTNTVDAALVAAWHLCQATMPRLTARKHASVLFILSDYAVIGLRDGAAFAASQAALYAFAKSLAREFAPAGIRVNCLGIAWMPAGRSEEVPLGRPGRPDDVAAAADFLLSDRASYISGQLLQPNGGRVMW
jgi:NAD(P)-dependent dehydrogenase (short-subunit alcohol dehydrogenase family)